MKAGHPHVHLRTVTGGSAEEQQQQGDALIASLPGGHCLWIGGSRMLLTISGNATLCALAEMMLRVERGPGYWDTDV
jgi:hypothetical protein